MPQHSFDEIQSPTRAQGLCVHRFDGWLAINRNSTDNPRIASSLGTWSAIKKPTMRFSDFRIARQPESGSVSVSDSAICIDEHLPVRLTVMLGSDGDCLQPLLTKCLA
jgi:hypothetical protein